jgi:ketosteroid isomerase-like protein
MATRHAADEADIRQRIDKLAEAIRAMDLEGAMSIYAPDVVSFDIEPPLQHLGAEAKRKNWAGALRCISIRSATRSVTSRSPWSTTSHSRTASIGSVAH